MTADETDPWIEYLALSEWDRMTLVAERERRWPAGAREEFERRGLLRETTPLESLQCPECPDEPPRDIVFFEHPITGEPKAVLPCSGCGPAEIPLDELCRWSIETRGLAEFLAAGLEAHGGTKEIVPDRLWRLGKTRWAGRPTTLFLGRALHRHDARDVLAEFERSTSAVLFFPTRQPETPTRNPVVSLDLVCTWNGHALELDCEYAAAQARPKRDSTRGEGPRRDGNRAVVKQRLKAELEAHLAAACAQVRTELEFGREPTLLPCPTRAELAVRCQTSRATVTRCFEEDAELQQRWDQAHDLLRIIGRGGA